MRACIHVYLCTHAYMCIYARTHACIRYSYLTCISCLSTCHPSCGIQACMHAYIHMCGTLIVRTSAKSACCTVRYHPHLCRRRAPVCIRIWIRMYACLIIRNSGHWTFMLHRKHRMSPTSQGTYKYANTHAHTHTQTETHTHTRHIRANTCLF